MTTTELPKTVSPVTVRAARAEDRIAVERLAELDSTRSLDGPVLLAEVDGEARAAVAVRDLRAIADPFRPTEDLVALLREHARRTRPAQSRRRGGHRFAIRAHRPALG